MKSAQVDPHLRAAHAAHSATGERLMSEALAERLGTDPDRDPYPGLLAATATAVLRSTLSFWAASGGEVPLDRLTTLAWQALAAGLPEDCALRAVTDVTDSAQTRGGKDDHR